jgi:deoxyxylulose-5-phosphate synthase
MAKLNKEKNTLTNKMNEIEKQNGGAEREDRKSYVKVFQDYINNMGQYDQEMYGTTAENKKHEGECDDTVNDLQEIEKEYADRVAARLKRDEISAIMQAKKEKQNE